MSQRKTFDKCKETDPYYYSLKRSSCDSNTWHIAHRTGEESSYGEMWQACCNNDCNYVLKYQTFGRPERYEFGGESYEKVTRKSIEKEIELQNKIADEGLTVHITDAWFCKNGGVIIMPALENTVRNLIQYVYDDPEIISKIIDKCLYLVKKLHKKGFYHGDTHLNNFMVTKRGKNYKYYFIDFGRSGKLDGDKEFIRQDYISIYMDLNNIKDNIKDGKKKDIIETKLEELMNFIQKL